MGIGSELNDTIAYLREGMVFLIASLLVAPLFQSLKISPAADSLKGL